MDKIKDIENKLLDLNYQSIELDGDNLTEVQILIEQLELELEKLYER